MERKVTTIKSKSIHAPIDDSDGIRISTMSRHTLSDGVTPDPLITDKSYDWWLSELAPPAALVGAWYRGEVSWENFTKYYNLFLTLPVQQHYIQVLVDLSQMSVVTLLCVEENSDECHNGQLLTYISKRISHP
jgi:uncharacterized protein YeaO (DUF488 family)